MNGPEVYATIFAIGPGKTDANIIWAGSDDGLVHVTRDGGKTWANVTPKEMPELGRVSQIDASRFEAGGAYVAVKKPLLNDLEPYIFKTTDFGQVVDEDHQRDRAAGLRPCRPRRPAAPRTALCRNATCRLRFTQ